MYIVSRGVPNWVRRSRLRRISPGSFWYMAGTLATVSSLNRQPCGVRTTSTFSPSAPLSTWGGAFQLSGTSSRRNGSPRSTSSRSVASRGPRTFRSSGGMAPRSRYLVASIIRASSVCPSSTAARNPRSMSRGERNCRGTDSSTVGSTVVAGRVDGTTFPSRA